MSDPIMSQLKQILWKTVSGEKELISCAADAPCCDTNLPFCTNYNCGSEMGTPQGPAVSSGGLEVFVTFAGFNDGVTCEPADPDNDEGTFGSGDCDLLNGQFHLFGVTNPTPSLPSSYDHRPHGTYQDSDSGMDEAEWAGTNGGFVHTRPENTSAQPWLRNYKSESAPGGSDPNDAKRYGFDQSSSGDNAHKHTSCLYQNAKTSRGGFFDQVSDGATLWALPFGFCGNVISPFHRLAFPAVPTDVLNISVEPEPFPWQEPFRSPQFSAYIAAQIYHPDFGKASVDDTKINIDVSVMIHDTRISGIVAGGGFNSNIGAVQKHIFSTQVDSEDFYCHNPANTSTSYNLTYDSTKHWVSDIAKSQFPGWGNANFSVCGGGGSSATIMFQPQL